MPVKNSSRLMLLPTITVASFALTWTSSYQDFSNYDLIFIFGIGAFFLILQLLTLKLVMRISANVVLTNGVFALFALFNVYSFHLIFITTFTGLDISFQAVLATVGLYIFFTLKEIADKSKTGLIAILGIILVLVAANAAPVFRTEIFGQIAAPDNGQESSQIADHNDSEKITKNLKFVKFEEQPNIFIVEFDSLMPEALLKKHLDLDQVPYSNFLKENFRSFNNMFADVVPTRGSLNSLLAFDTAYFKEMVPEKRSELYSGQELSPLAELFRRNGYTINTLNASNYMGNSKGPYIDNYFVGIPFTVCEFIDAQGRSIAFFGFCAYQDTYFWQMQILYQGPMKHLLASFEQQLKKDEPQLFLAYLFSPGHTKLSYKSNNPADKEEYRQEHMTKSSETADMLKQIKVFVDRSGSNSILIVTGDHGPYMSRTLKFNTDANFYIRDRYGIYGGVYPRDRCNSYFNELDNLGYGSPIIIMESLIRCLSGGQEPFVIPQHIVGPVGASQNRSYNRFRYE